MLQTLLRPARRFLDLLAIPWKFLIIALVFLLAAVVPTFLMVRSQNNDIAIATREQGGVQFFKPASTLVRDVTLHALALPGDGKEDPDRQQAARALESAIAEDLGALAGISPALQNTLGIRDDLPQLQAHWTTLVTGAGKGSPAQQHLDFLEEIRHLESKAMDVSMLTSDPEVVTSYLGDAAIVQIPDLDFQGLRLALLVQKQYALPLDTDSPWRGQVQHQTGTVWGNLQVILETLGPTKALADPEAAHRLQGLLQANNEATIAFLSRCAGLTEGPGTGSSPALAALAFASRQSLQSGFMLQETTLRILEDMLLQRIRRLRLDQRLAVGGSLVAAFLAFYLLAGLYSGLRSGFLALGFSLEALAGGDLTRRPKVTSQDELGTLARHLDQALEHVAALVTQIQVSAQTILAASGGLAQESQDLSRRTEAQAVSLEQTTASLGNLSTAVAHTGAQARQADQDSGKVDDLTKACSTAVGQTAHAIQEINQASSQVLGVTGIVEEVSFHANLLAVDAAVTAAAGDRERGFTALAAQVHGLGKRGQDASRQIRNLLDETLGAIRRGMESAAQAEGAVEEITRDLRGVTSAITEITGAAQEQSAGLVQIRQAMEELGAVTQRNASMAAQTQEALQDLARHARLLADLTATFKV